VLAPMAVLANSACERDRSQCGPRRKLVLVKGGGSALTKKASFETLNTPLLESTAQQVKAALTGEAPPQIVFVHVHGAGSFGHFQAREYATSSGGRPHDWQKGASIVRRSVTKLHGFVMDAFLAAGVDAAGVSTWPTVTVGQDHRVAQAGSLLKVNGMLALGFTPVLHGDVALTSDKNCTILSGDEILRWLCFSADLEAPTPGVAATLLSTILVGPDGGIQAYQADNQASTISTEVASHDVTGGIAAKVQAAARIAELGVPVYIVQAGTTHAAAALRGERPAICTAVVRHDKLGGNVSNTG